MEMKSTDDRFGEICDWEIMVCIMFDNAQNIISFHKEIEEKCLPHLQGLTKAYTREPFVIKQDDFYNILLSVEEKLNKYKFDVNAMNNDDRFHDLDLYPTEVRFSLCNIDFDFSDLSQR